MGGTAYRGPERRRIDDGTLWARAWLAVATLVGVLLLVVAWLVLDARSQVESSSALQSLYTAETVLAVVMVATGLAHWRAVGRTHGLHVAIAGTILGLVSLLDLGLVLGSVGLREGMRSALSLTAALWVGRAVLGPEVDTSLRALRSYLVAGLTVAAAASLMGLLYATGDGGSLGGRVWALVAAAVWSAVAAVGIVRSVAENWGLLGWVSWAGVALALGELARWQMGGPNGAWGFADAAIGAAGLLVAAVGGIWALARVAISNRGDVYGMVLQGRSQQQRDEDLRRQLVHEVRNALLAVEGATSTMECLGDRIDDDQQRELQRILRAGVHDLRVLTADPATDRRGEPFSLDEVVAGRVAAARVRGVPVRVVGRRGVVAQGDPSTTGRVVTNLLLNAERHGGAGPEAPVTVDVDVHDDGGVPSALVRVMDRGPGVPPDARDHVFREGYQADPTRVGDGIGLHVARTLAHQQDGRLHYRQRRDGGACFELFLPLATRVEEVDGPSPDEVQDGG